MRLKISVIVPVYNTEDYLDDCISSIVNQTYRNLEIILIDDCSTDSSAQICDNWARKDDRIQVIHKMKGGLSEARNYGLNICTGELIAFVDSDDWIDPKMYMEMLSAMEASGADICACGRVYEGSGVRKPVVAFDGTPEMALKMLFSYPSFPVDVWNKLYKKKIWEGVRFPSKKNYEDVFVACRLIDNAKLIKQISNEFYHYRIRSGSITRSGFSVSKMDEEEGWRFVYTYIRNYHANLFKEAFSFYLIKVAIILSSIPKEQRLGFSKEIRYMRNTLCKNLLFCAICAKISFFHKCNILKLCMRLDSIVPCTWGQKG